MRTDMDLEDGRRWACAASLVEAPAEGGIELAVKTDAMAVRTSSEAVDRRSRIAADAEVTRLRLGLEGSWRGRDARHGHAGADGWRSGCATTAATPRPASGSTSAAASPGTTRRRASRGELRGRGLLTHESKGFRERGSLRARFALGPAGRAGGPSLTLSQTLGASASGGADALLGPRDARRARGERQRHRARPARRLELQFGYGFAAFGDRFTSTPELGFGLSDGHREYSLGWRLARDPRPGDIGSLELLFEARRQESANDNDPPEHAIRIEFGVRF